MSHYDARYFEWQSALGRFSGSLNAPIFSAYIRNTDTILDFGCGGGFLLDSLTARSKLGVEINPSARATASKLGIDTVATLDDVPDSQYDVVISNHALEHTVAPMDIVGKTLVKLKPGGLAIFVVPCERYDTKYVQDSIDQHLYTWSPQNLGNLFCYAGFDIVTVRRVIHRWPPKVDAIDRLFGRAFCHAMCRLYGFLRPKLTQVQIVARRPPS